MSETAPQKTTVDKIREMPIGSGAVAVAGALSLTEVFNAGLLFFATPIASAAVAVAGAVNAFDRKRSGLSRAFSAAAAVVGVAGAAAPFAIAGSAALGGFFIAAATMTAAGAFNVAAYALRNKKLPFSLSFRRNKPVAAPTV